MNNPDDKDYVDAEYRDANEDNNINKSKSEDKIIRGEPLFYSCTQVAQIVGVEPSTIRYWTRRFSDLLDVEISNKNKQYRKSDIEKLKFIRKLAKEDGLTLQQVEEYCTSKGFDINDIEKQILDTSNPLAVQTFITIATIEMDKKLNAFSEELLSKIDNKTDILDDKLKQYLILQAEESVKVAEKLKQDVVITVDEVMSEKLEVTNQLQQDNKKLLEEIAIDMAEMKEINNKLKEILDNPETKEKLVKSVKKENDGWISRLAKKFNK